MSYYETDFQRAHTGNGGMTSSLAMGVMGSAADRRAAMFPLSPFLNDGRSKLATVNAPLLDPRTYHTTTTPEQMITLVNEQWYSRSRRVNSRAAIEAALAERSA